MQKYGTWTQLREPSANEEILTRHDPEHPLDFWRGKDSQGRYLFALEGLKLPVRDVPLLEGIAISCESSPDDKFSLRLTLENAEDLPLFSALSQDLTSATFNCQMEDNDAGAAIVVTRLIRWQKMLKKRRSRLLSKSEIVGLFGEVSFLVNVLFEAIPVISAVKSWRGGFGDEQDFAFNNLIIEAKTVGATSDATIRISSEHQLDTASGDIAVRYQTVTETEPSIEGAETLNELIDRLRDRLITAGSDVHDALEAALLAWGYERLPEYDRYGWSLGVARNYEVTDEFPRITAADLRLGVEGVVYQVAVDAMSEYQRSDEWLIKKIIDEDD